MIEAAIMEIGNPFYAVLKNGNRLYTGIDPDTGEPLSAGEKVLAAAGFIPGVASGKNIIRAGKTVNTVSKSKKVGKVTDTGKYLVGSYKTIKGVKGLDVHHAGQKAVMKKLVNNYDPLTAPAINISKVGHTIKGPNGIVSRKTKGIDSPRQLLARDIMELRRVYDDIPNTSLKDLIELNKKMYPEMSK